MDANEHNKSIRDLTRQIEAMKPTLDQAIEQVTLETVGFLHHWADETLKRMLRDNPEKVRAMGDHQRTRAKRELEDARSQFDKLVRDKFSEPGIWVHRREALVGEFDYQAKEALKQSFQDALRSMMSHYGALLHKHGFIDQSESEWSVAGDSVRFRTGIPMTTTLERAYADYESLAGNFIKLHSALSKAQRTKSADEATDLWDKT